ncbi:MAG: hypothetical protein QFE16_12000 [Pseudomonadota bacterium]|nr:hypothetical protein [Pseudomonadota bacterium]
MIVKRSQTMRLQYLSGALGAPERQGSEGGNGSFFFHVFIVLETWMIVKRSQTMRLQYLSGALGAPESFSVIEDHSR